MTLPNLRALPIICSAMHDFQICKHCQEKTPGLILRHWRFAWSTSCERCGRSLVSTNPHGAISKRTKARAVQGAKRLAAAVISGDQEKLHQFRQALDLLQLWELAHSDQLISATDAKRTLALAAIELGSRRSLLRVAYRVGRNNNAARSLLRAFPRQSETLGTIQKLARLSENQYSKREVIVRRTTVQCPNTTKPLPSKRAITAARSAIQELGSDADRHALLLRAQEIWLAETISRRFSQAVDIS